QSSTTLAEFRLNRQDIELEVVSSLDPDFPNDRLLGAIRTDDLDVVLAVILLNGGIDSARLAALARDLGAAQVIAPRLDRLSPAWDRLRRSILERRHTLGIEITPS